jgi:hypothetical protein
MDIPRTETDFLQISFMYSGDSRDLPSWELCIANATSLIGQLDIGKVKEIGPLRRSDLSVWFLFSTGNYFQSYMEEIPENIIEFLRPIKDVVARSHKALQFEFLFLSTDCRVLAFPDARFFSLCQEKLLPGSDQTTQRKSEARSESSTVSTVGEYAMARTLGVVRYSNKNHVSTLGEVNCTIINNFLGHPTFIWEAAKILIDEYYLLLGGAQPSYNEAVWNCVMSRDGNGVVRILRHCTLSDFFFFAHLLLDPCFKAPTVDAFVISSTAAFSENFRNAVTGWQDPALKARLSLRNFINAILKLQDSQIFSKYTLMKRAGLEQAWPSRNELLAQGNRTSEGVTLLYKSWTYFNLD